MAIFGRTSQRDVQRAEAYRRWLVKRNPFAIASLVLGVISLIEFGVLLIFGVAGIITGIIALVQLKRNEPLEEPAPAESARRGTEMLRGPDVPDYAGGPADQPGARGHGLAIAGIALSAISLVMAVLIYRMPPGGGG